PRAAVGAGICHKKDRGSALDPLTWRKWPMDLEPFEATGESTSTGAMTLRRNLSLHTLASVSRLLATLDFEEILDSIVCAAMELLGGARGFLFLIDDAGTFTMRVGRCAGGGEILPGGAHEISMSLVRRALKEKRC